MKNEADAAYHKAVAEVEHLMVLVQRKLASHARRQEADKGNWGYAGDMTHYADLLKQLLGEGK